MALEHISVCVCTYKRPQLLQRLLEALGQQQNDALFTYSVVIVDNDAARSAETIVQQWGSRNRLPIEYYVEPRQNIALARNKAVGASRGEYVAMIDDDEFPTERWLLTLFNDCNLRKVDGTLGPVKPHFEEPPPRWILKGSFYERPDLESGKILSWSDCRTGNALLRASVFSSNEQAFRPEFRGGEDRDFFRRKIEQGYRFAWCGQAVVYEAVPPLRWKRSFMLRRAMLRGAVMAINRSGPLGIVKSIAAVLTYTATLPFVLLMGQHHLMNVLIRLFSHLGKLLALAGLNPVREPYVTG